MMNTWSSAAAGPGRQGEFTFNGDAAAGQPDPFNHDIGAAGEFGEFRPFLCHFFAPLP
jgi:hypothetical protein